MRQQDLKGPAPRRPTPEYCDADIREYLRLLQRRRRGYDGPDPKQWVGVEQFLTPYVQE